MSACRPRPPLPVVALLACWTACAGPSGEPEPRPSAAAPTAVAGEPADGATSGEPAGRTGEPAPPGAAAAGDAGDAPTDQPDAPAQQPEAADDPLDEFLDGPVPHPTPLGDGAPPEPVPPRPLPEPDPFGDHATPTEIEAPAGLPYGEDEGVLRFERFGPAPGTAPEEFERWSRLVTERFLGDPTPERAAELDAALATVPIVDATPVFINALHGLDMGDPEDITRAGAVASYWYDGMVKYKHVVIDDDTRKLTAVDVRNRMLVVDGWVRLWQRTLDREGGVDRLRSRVEQLIADREASRRRARERYEEKLRRRAAEQGGDADAGDDGPR